MDRIVLEVDDSLGRVYRNLSPESRQQFCQLASLIIRKAAIDETLAGYRKMLDEIGCKALTSGLTPGGFGRTVEIERLK